MPIGQPDGRVRLQILTSFAVGIRSYFQLNVIKLLGRYDLQQLDTVIRVESALPSALVSNYTSSKSKKTGFRQV